MLGPATLTPWPPGQPRDRLQEAAGRRRPSAARAALAGRVRALVPSTPTPWPRGTTGDRLPAGGPTAEAIRLHERALAGRLRSWVPSTPDTLASRNNLALAASRWAGRPRRSRRSSGPWPAGSGCSVPSTPTPWPRGTASRRLPGGGLGGRGDRLFEQTLAGRVRVLGPGHPDTLASRNNLGHAYQEAGRVPEAIALFEQPWPRARGYWAPATPRR